MILYIVITLIVVFVAGLILSIGKFSQLRAKYGDLVAYILPTVLAVLLTLLGVYLADNRSRVTERESLIELLKSGLQDIRQTRVDLIVIVTFCGPGDSSGQNSYAEFVARNEVPYPTILFSLLDDEKVLSNMNELMLMTTRTFEKNLRQFERWLKQDSISNDEARDILFSYGEQVWAYQYALRMFIEYLAGQISEGQFFSFIQIVNRVRMNEMNAPHSNSDPRQHPWLDLGRDPTMPGRLGFQEEAP